MIDAGNSLGSRPHCFKVYPLIKALYKDWPMLFMPFSSKLRGLLIFSFPITSCK